MSKDNLRGYGAGRLWPWYCWIRDRLHGDRARANARLGYLRPPFGTGRVVWIKAGGNEASVRMAAEILSAIRHRRLDVRLILSFEEAYPDVVASRAQGLKKVAVGYGPCDSLSAVSRALARLDPFALIYVNCAGGTNLITAANRRRMHVVAFNAPVPIQGCVEASYPVDGRTALAWEKSCAAEYVAPAADALTLLTEAQVEPVLNGLVGGDLDLWWLHGPTREWIGAFLDAWLCSGLVVQGVLFVSVKSLDSLLELESGLKAMNVQILRMSDWQRVALAPGSIVLLDEQRWLPAVAAACTGAHLITAERSVWWQALAGGSPVTISGGAREQHAQAVVLPVEDLPQGIVSRWQQYRYDPIEARRQGDECRKLFWKERRRAAEVLQEFLQRVFDW